MPKIYLSPELLVLTPIFLTNNRLKDKKNGMLFIIYNHSGEVADYEQLSNFFIEDLKRLADLNV